MNIKHIVTRRSTVLGFVSWFVPFAVSFLFFDRTGQLLIARPLFKSLMVVIGGGTGAALLVVAFRRITPSTRSGLALGCYWLAINLILDLVVLVSLVGVPVVTYLYDIGLRYLLLPIVSLAIGMVAEKARQQMPPGRS